jgi:hypothetical protein
MTRRWLVVGLCALTGCSSRPTPSVDGAAAQPDQLARSDGAPDSINTGQDWGACACTIGAACLPAGGKDATHCAMCDPSKSRTAWSPAPYGCKLSYDGVELCFLAGETSTPCRVCDPGKSTTAWSLTGYGCWISDKCYAPGDPSTTGCGVCDLTHSLTSWKPLPYDCKIAGQCYKAGDTDGMGCGVCDPSKSTTAWTPTYDCKIAGNCYKTGDQDSSGCGACDPSRSSTSWSLLAPLAAVLTDDFSAGTVAPWNATNGKVEVVGGELSLLSIASDPGRADQSLATSLTYFDITTTMRLSTSWSQVSLCVGVPGWMFSSSAFYCITLSGGSAPGAHVHHTTGSTGLPDSAPLISFPFTPGVGASHTLRLTRGGLGELELFVDGISKGTVIDTQVGGTSILFLSGQHAQGTQGGHGGTIDNIVIEGC